MGGIEVSDDGKVVGKDEFFKVWWPYLRTPYGAH